jgi:NAD+ kinase
VGDSEAAVAAVERAGATPLVGDARAVCEAGTDAAVATGASAAAALARAGYDRPVLPVAVGPSLPAVVEADLEEAVARLADGRFETARYPVAVADAPSVTARALFDLALVTDVPARISEYSVATGDERVARFRADGVVVATPAGSHGYARAAGGPAVAPGTGVLAVVPVAPFATDVDRWVLPADDVTLRVERDEASVRLLADDTEAGDVPPGVPVRIATGGGLAVAVVPASGSVLG